MHQRFMQVLQRVDDGGSDNEGAMRGFWSLPESVPVTSLPAPVPGPVVDITIWRRARERRRAECGTREDGAPEDTHSSGFERP